MHPLFVYGTLQPGQRNWPLLEDATLKHKAAKVKGYRLWEHPTADYPAITPGPGDVFGALITLDPARYEQTLNVLDRLEDYNAQALEQSLYWRILATTYDPTTDAPLPEQAWVYAYNPRRIHELEQHWFGVGAQRWPARQRRKGFSE